MKIAKLTGLCVFTWLAMSACGRTSGLAADPKLPRTATGQSGGAPVKPQSPGVDWSFLGAPNPDLVREQALYISPLVGGGNLADDPEDLEQRTGDAVLAWVRKHVQIAATGSAGVVRLTMTRCVGWGSVVPSSYTLFGCFTPMAVFVHPSGSPAFVKACDACNREDEACVEKWCGPRRVEGYFTGKIHTEFADPDDPSTGRQSYEFRVLNDAATGGSPVEPTALDPELALLLPAGSPQPDGELIGDGPRFAVAASFDRVWAPTSLTLAQRLRDQLAQAGFSDPIVIDSRRIRTQWCCAHVVIAARADTAAAAECIRLELTAKNLAKFEVIELY